MQESSHGDGERVYGKLGEISHPSELIEYRVEQHREKLQEEPAAFPTDS